jgi:lipopolysaccharide export system protein LptA
MITYIIKSSLSLIVLFGLYWFILRHEKLFKFNRVFLIFSVLISLAVPFISIPLSIVDKESQENILTTLNSAIPTYSSEQIAFNSLAPQPSYENKWIPAPVTERIYCKILIFLYISGVLIFLVRFIRNIFFIYRQMRMSEKITFSGHRLVLTDNQINPFCFLNTIFVSKQDYYNNYIAAELLTHEIEHIKQSHSIDVIFIELIKIIYWFNPILILYGRAIRVNHEYMADNGVIQGSSDINNYAEILLNFVSCKRDIPITSGFNQSLTKKRLMMLTRSKSKGIILKIRVLITLGLVIILTLLLSVEQAKTQPITSMPNYKGVLDTLLIDKNYLATIKNILNPIPQSIDINDKKITYTATGHIKQDTINQMLVLVDNAIVSFGEITIKADSIVFNRRTNQIYAIGRQGSSGTIISKPIFKEGSQEMEADEITYSMNTRKAVVKNVKAQVTIKIKDSGSLVNSPTPKQIDKSNNDSSKSIGNEDMSNLPENEKPELFPLKKDELTEIKRNFGEKNIHPNTADFLFLNSDQLKPLGIELNKDGVFYKNLNPNWKQDKVRYSCLSFYCSSNNYLTTNHYSETDVIKARNRNERLLVKMEITRNDFYPILIGNTIGKQGLNNETLSEDLKLFPVAICMSETKLRNRKDTIVVWFKPSEALKKALPENVKIEDYLKLPIRTK